MAVRGAEARRAAMRDESSPYGGKSGAGKSKKASSSAVDSTNSTFELSASPPSFASPSTLSHFLQSMWASNSMDYSDKEGRTDPVENVL